MTRANNQEIAWRAGGASPRSTGASILPLISWLALAAHACAAPLERSENQPVFPGEARATASRIADVQKQIEDGKLTEALGQLQQILDTAGNDLVPLDGRRSVQARRLCHALIASLSPEGLELYRKRAEPHAARLLQTARSGESHVLRRIVDEAFCTRAGEEAINLLGDQAFEAGHFDEAANWWRMVLPAADKARDVFARPLQYPDSRQKPA